MSSRNLKSIGVREERVINKITTKYHEDYEKGKLQGAMGNGRKHWDFRVSVLGLQGILYGKKPIP